ncbi:hypothetical protein IGI04_019748 [Brassica rapa subsp. trilocularis]|uniref:BHLH domain-containing protein n=1 Tax=Brassica rapa subsp. trilocularis TaxID=1813537 RepID=A0ABQ7MK51_BRACM|nr:hypothetical protein IGI04_019748 [Brassica rapa subsp. trilocularis]
MEASSSHVSITDWLLLSALTTTKIGFPRNSRYSVRRRFPEVFSIKSILLSLLDALRSVSSRFTMDPAEERRHSKRQNDYINRLGSVVDSEYGIPRRCPCGGRIIDEVRRKDDYDTLPGKRKQIETLEEQVKILCGQVDYLTVQVATLEKVSFD